MSNEKHFETEKITTQVEIKEELTHLYNKKAFKLIDTLAINEATENEQETTGSIFSKWHDKATKILEAEEKPDNINALSLIMELTQPDSNHRRILLAYYGIKEQMPWRFAFKKIITKGIPTSLDISDPKTIQDTWINSDTFVDIHTAEVTFRTFDQYMEMFNLPNDALAGNILDLGGGLADFTQEVNRRKNGFCISLDPSYKLLREVDPKKSPEENYITYSREMAKRSFATVGDFSGNEESNTERIIGNRLIEILSDKNNVLTEGISENLPFKKEAFDLILSSNFLLRPNLQLNLELPKNQQMFLEAFRTLKKTGELRIFPIYNFFTNGNDEIEFDGGNTMKNADAFVELEKQGLKFYYVVNPRKGSWICVKKSEDPPILFEDKTELKIFKLDFSSYDNKQPNKIPAQKVK